MKALLALVPVTIFALASCGSGATTTSPAPGESGGNKTMSSGTTPATCRPTCATPADCATPGEPLSDAAHYACNAGLCDWLGCKAASECSAAAGGGTFVCRTLPGATVADCIPACQTAADCVPPGATSVLDDAHHFACTGGVCTWRGCASTAECMAALHTSRVSCETPPGAPAPTCVPTCATASNCVATGAAVPALSDPSHYTCTASRCAWLGCKSTAECAQALQTNKVVCE